MQNPKGCWRMCIAATVALFCTLGLNLNAFSVYVPYLTKLLALTPNQNSAYLMVRNLCSVCAVYLAKKYYRKLDIRLGLSATMLMTAISLYLYSRAQNFTALCIAAAISGLSYGAGGMYPVAILLHRWFSHHERLAMGICTASSGFALTVCSPILTFLIETRSMVFAMYCEIGFILLCMVICFFMIRNHPEGSVPVVQQQNPRAQRAPVSMMLFAMAALGMLGGSFSYLTIHYTTEGFDPYQVSTVISLIGLTLTISQFLLGGLMDTFGTYRVNWFFLSLLILGCSGFSVGGLIGYRAALIFALLFGVGDAAVTVGVSTYAIDLSTPENYSSVQQQYQGAKLLGTTICTLIPGLIATATGSYRPFYLVIACLSVFATVVIQTTYAKKKKGSPQKPSV